MPKRVVTADGEYWVDDQGNPIDPPENGRRGGETPPPPTHATPSSTYNPNAGAPGTSGGTFIDRLKATIAAAYPTKSKDAAWLDSQVKYYLGRQAAEGPKYDEDYWLKRAAGWQAGGADIAEAGDYSLSGKYGPQTQDTTLGAWPSGDLADWWAQNAPSIEPYSTPERPDYLSGEYKAPVWNETFTAPDANALYADPGYQARLAAAQKGFERSAAAKGTLLSGGTQVALGRQMQDLASQEYGQAFNRAMGAYQQRYGQFQDAANLGMAARGINENAYNTNVSNSLNQYNTRYKTYRDAVDDQFRLADYGLRAAGLGAPGGA